MAADSITEPNRAERFDSIETQLLATAKGLTKTELAERLGVNKSTVGRDIARMEELGYSFVVEQGRYRMDAAHCQTRVALSIYEVQALHLATRLYAQTMRFPFPHAVQALEKLAEAQKRISPALAEGIARSAAELAELESKTEASVQTRHVELLTKAIHDRRLVSLNYHSRRSGAAKTYRLLPIQIEPYATGLSVYLVAMCLPEGTDRDRPHIRIFKLQHIQSIEPGERSSKDYQDHCRSLLAAWPRSQAWGLWKDDRPAATVRLRFTPDVAARVAETLWHPDQTITPVPDSPGAIEWSAPVTAWEEMIPWIRGWGRDCWVLGPEELVEFLRGRGELIGGSIP